MPVEVLPALVEWLSIARTTDITIVQIVEQSVHKQEVHKDVATFSRRKPKIFSVMFIVSGISIHHEDSFN